MENKNGYLLIIHLKNSLIGELRELYTNEEKMEFIIKNLFNDKELEIYERFRLDTRKFNTIDFSDYLIKIDGEKFHTHSIRPLIYKTSCRDKEILTKSLFKNMTKINPEEIYQDCLNIFLYDYFFKYILILGNNTPKEKILIETSFNSSPERTEKLNRRIEESRFGMLIKLV